MSALSTFDDTPHGTAHPCVEVDRSESAATVTSADATTIGYTTLGSGDVDAVIVVGGVLRTAQDYMGLGRALAESVQRARDGPTRQGRVRAARRASVFREIAAYEPGGICPRRASAGLAAPGITSY